MNNHVLRVTSVCTLFILFLFSAGVSTARTTSSIEYGCAIDAVEQIQESRALAERNANPDDPQWRAKGDLHRAYHFPEADADMPYRLYVPESWDGTSPLPLLVFLHGAGSDENRYLEANDRQLIRLAEKHGYILLSPLGYSRIAHAGQCPSPPRRRRRAAVVDLQRCPPRAQHARPRLSGAGAPNVAAGYRHRGRGHRLFRRAL